MNEIGHQFSCLVNSFHLAATKRGVKRIITEGRTVPQPKGTFINDKEEIKCHLDEPEWWTQVFSEPRQVSGGQTERINDFSHNPHRLKSQQQHFSTCSPNVSLYLMEKCFLESTSTLFYCNDPSTRALGVSVLSCSVLLESCWVEGHQLDELHLDPVCPVSVLV